MDTLMNTMAANYLVFVIGRFCWLTLRFLGREVIPHRNSFSRTNKSIKKVRHVHKK